MKSKKQDIRPSLLLYDYLDNEAVLISVQCNNHVDFELFKSQCVLVHKRAPLKIYHQWQTWKTITGKKEDEEKTLRPFKTNVNCDPHTNGAEPITIGYYNTVDYTQSHNNQQEF